MRWLLIAILVAECVGCANFKITRVNNGTVVHRKTNVAVRR